MLISLQKLYPHKVLNQPCRSGGLQWTLLMHGAVANSNPAVHKDTQTADAGCRRHEGMCSAQSLDVRSSGVAEEMPRRSINTYSSCWLSRNSEDSGMLYRRMVAATRVTMAIRKGTRQPHTSRASAVANREVHQCWCCSRLKSVTVHMVLVQGYGCNTRDTHLCAEHNS